MIELNTLKKMMKEVRENKDFLDSVSPNQYRSKEVLIKHVENLQLVDQNSEIVIFGGWYGTILIPAFKYVDKITLIDKDPKAISIAKHRIFDHYKNIDFISKDVFDWAPDSKRIKTCNLIINTSCEHMPSMKKLELDTKSYFAYQSNNMYDIEGHINCVSSIEEFKWQLPDNAKVMVEDKITDERGTRFLLVGKYE